MRIRRVSSVLLALGLAPRTASATSLARCETYSTSGLAAPWSTAELASPEDGTLWSLQSGRLWRTIAGGSETAVPGDETLASIAFPTPRDGWAAGGSGAVLHTRDGGRTWDRPSVGTTRDLRLIRCADAARCLVLADDGTLLRTVDGGRMWTPSPFRASKDVTDLFVRGDDAWMVSASGAFFDTHDGGLTWGGRVVEAGAEGPPALDLVRFADRDLGWITSGERLLRTTDGGASWNETLRLDAGLSFVAVESPDGRDVQAAVRGSCEGFEQSGGNFRSEDGGATWEDVVGAEERDADWEALVQDPSATAHLTRALRAADTLRWGKSFVAVEASPIPDGLRLKSIVVRERACGDVEIGATEEAPRPGWEAGDPCRLDPDRADEVLARFADRPAGADGALFVECGRERKTFHLPESIQRRRLARVSPSLVRLMEMSDRMETAALSRRGLDERARRAGLAEVPRLRSGAFDVGIADPAAFRALLERYEGPLSPKGLLGRVEVDLPPDVVVLDAAPPQYPDIALMARVEGTVVLDLGLEADGAVKDAEVVRGIPLLDAAALHVARHWRFRFEASDTTPVRVSFRFAIDRCGRGGLLFDH